ncbi:MAG: thymidine phosphorylase [Sulfurovum sp.]|nr:thymidine phosphorylase [Sulfurovum sp.]
MFIPQEFIRKKRDNKPLNKDEIQQFVQGVTDGSVANEHISAFAMAVFFNGMSLAEKTDLTIAMKNSGNTLSWDLNGPIVDKHSTGGVGDVVSLMLGPMLSACGAFVPMISGRGLGHTGGTLDKLESIPGYSVLPDDKLFKKVVKDCGVAIIGQTSSLAPADKRIYSIRDVTATVESIPMISASILSKKLAEGLDSLIMDVKVGSGAFMPTYKLSRELAMSIVEIANNAGVKTQAILTDMNQSLAYNAGNALEVREAVEYLLGKKINPRLHAVTMGLCIPALVNSGLAKDEKEAKVKLEESLSSGKALEIFAKMISMLGGPSDFCDRYESYLPQAKIIEPIFTQESGLVESMDVIAIGMGIVGLGGGRIKPEDQIDHSVGLENIINLGSKIDRHTPLCTIHAKDRESFNEAKKRLLEAVRINDNAVKIKEIYETIG